MKNVSPHAISGEPASRDPISTSTPSKVFPMYCLIPSSSIARSSSRMISKIDPTAGDEWLPETYLGRHGTHHHHPTVRNRPRRALLAERRGGSGRFFGLRLERNSAVILPSKLRYSEWCRHCWAYGRRWHVSPCSFWGCPVNPRRLDRAARTPPAR